MRLLTWLQTRPTDRPRAGRTTPRKSTSPFRPRLEVLEGRDVPSSLQVTNVGDGGRGSLRYEIAQAQSGDTIVFNFGNKKANATPHTITLFSGNELDVNKNLTIQGPGAGLLTINSQNGIDNSRIFEVGSGATVALSGMTLNGGGGFANDINLGRLHDGFGGAVLNFGTLTIAGCTLSNNSAAQPPDSGTFGWPLSEGGAIYNAGMLTVNGCTLVNNSADLGGAISNEGFGTAVVNGCTLTGNLAYGSGGAIYNTGSAAALTVSNSAFSGNIVSGDPWAPQDIWGLYTDGGGNTFS